MTNGLQRLIVQQLELMRLAIAQFDDQAHSLAAINLANLTQMQNLFATGTKDFGGRKTKQVLSKVQTAVTFQVILFQYKLELYLS